MVAVLVAHFGSAQFINLGRFGVELFFVLSGRLMGEILFVRKTPLRSFFPRRVSRVYPALFVLAATLYAISLARGAGDPSLPQFLVSITFVANYAQFWIGRSEVLDHIWSLCIEEHLYLCLGLLALASRRWRVPVIPICVALALAAIVNGMIQTALGLDYYAVYWRTDVRGASILIGVIAYLSLHERAVALPIARWAAPALGIAALALNVNVVPDGIKYSLGTICLAVGLLLIPAGPRWLLRLLELPILRTIGLWSYSIYLWQQPFAKTGGHLLDRIVLVPVVLMIAYLSFRLVEQPARAALNRLWHTRRPSIVEG